jgi:hypothetical protein
MLLSETMVDLDPILAVASDGWQLLAGAGVALLGLWRLLKRVTAWIHGLRDSIIESVKIQTYPIQAHANGGNSLPDATNMLREIGERTARIEGSLTTHLDWHNGG